MATFECTSHSSLLIVGAGQFVDGQLEANGDAADVVRKIAATGSFDITETEEQQEPNPKDEDPKGEDPKDDESKSKDDELFDPSEHNAESVIEYLATLDAEDPEAREAERQRIIAAEQSGKARKGVLSALEDDSIQE